MAMWNRCAICGKSIPVGELCYGVKNWRGEPTNGDTICRDCLVPENSPTLTPPNEWVSVDERLPEDEKAVLAYYGFNRGDGDLGMMFQGVLTYFSCDANPHWQHEGTGLTVTHWMSLPEPPDRRPPEGELNG